MNYPPKFEMSIWIFVNICFKLCVPKDPDVWDMYEGDDHKEPIKKDGTSIPRKDLNDIYK